jgi:hypothetical protein
MKYGQADWSCPFHASTINAEISVISQKKPTADRKAVAVLAEKKVRRQYDPSR